MDYPLTQKQVLSLKYRKDLNTILNDADPTNGQRLFLVCFLRDKCNWDEYSVIELILKHAKWRNLDSNKTTRHVNQIFEKKTRFKDLRSGSKNSLLHGSKCTDSVETCTSETQQATAIYKKVVETRLRRFYNVESGSSASSAEFQVSTSSGALEQEETTMSNDLRSNVRAPPQTLRNIATINSGDRYYRIAEKEGQFGGFFSLESGWLSEVEYEGKQLKVPGRAEKYFTLPSDKETMEQLIAGLQQLLPPVEVQVAHKKK